MCPLTKQPGGQVSSAKKSLSFMENVNINEKQVQDSMTSSLNIDDLDTTKSSAVKVVIAYPNGRVVVKRNFDENTLVIIKDTCLSRWEPVVNAFLRHEFLSKELIRALEREVNRECKTYCKSDSCLKSSEPDQLAIFSNNTVCREIKIHCPFLSTVLSSASNLNNSKSEKNTERAINAIALATSTLIRCRNPTMSSIAYRMSTILSHSGVSYQDNIRLNYLGVCMSPKRMIAFQEKMGVNSDYKVKIWKKTIENNKCSRLLLEEVVEKQVPKKVDDDMDITTEVDLKQDSIKDYQWYSPHVYESTIQNLEAVRQRMNEPNYTDDVLKESLE